MHLPDSSSSKKSSPQCSPKTSSTITPCSRRWAMADRAIHVRLAEPRDAEGIVALMQEVQAVHVAGRPDLFKPGGTENASQTRERMQAPGNFMWVATLDTDVVGYAFARM